MSNRQHVPQSLASDTKEDGVNVAVSAAAAAIAIAAAVEMSEYGPAVQASRGTVAQSDSLYDDEEEQDRRYSRPSHSASYGDGPQHRWQWGVLVPYRHPCVKAHQGGGSTARTLPSAASHPGEVAVALRPSKPVCWGGAARRAASIDAAEPTAPAIDQVVVPAGSSSALV